MYSPTTRLLTLLELLQSKQNVSGVELAETLEVEVRSVRRYVTMLRDMGIPVESEKGRYGSYSLRPGFRMPPLMFTDTEVLSLILGLMAVRRLGMATAGGSESAAAKIERVLPDELRERVRAFQGVLTLDMPAYQAVREEVLARFSIGAYQRSRLWIEYWGGSRGSATERAVDVYGLVYHTGYWYAIGYCHLREDLRVFRLDRVRKIRLMDEKFAVPQDFDALEYLNSSFASIQSVWDVRVRFKATLAEAKQRVSPDVGILEATPEGVILNCYADGLDWMAHFLINTRLKFTVLEPPELREKLREVARSILRMAREETDVYLFELELTAMTHGGRALGRHEGKPIFVPFGLPGERVRVHITQDKRSYAFAEVEAVVTQSPERITPRCPHFGICGGCHWQHIDYAAQLRFKRDVVVEQMARIGGLRDALVHPTLASPDPWRYRSHVTFHVTSAGRLGFVGVDDHSVVPIEECYIIRPELSDWFDSLKTEHFTPGDRVRLQVGSDGASERLIARSGSSPEPDDEAVLASAERVHYRIKGHDFQVTGGSFFQVNLPQAERLVDLVLERLALRGNERVLDLYSGVGLFTAFLAEQAQQVTGVEVYAPAVRDAQINLAGFSNVELRVGTIESALPRGRVDAVVIDPPRAGMKPKALEALVARAPQKIAYVSCDPATLARDAKALVASGYQLIDVQPVDMFPQTYHVEAVAAFTRSAT